MASPSPSLSLTPPTQQPSFSSNLPTIQLSALNDFYYAMNVFQGQAPGQDSSWNFVGTPGCSDCTNCKRSQQWNFASPTVGTDPCTPNLWCGVTCDGNTPPNVQTIKLTGMSLQGTLPTSIADLSGLTALRLNKNLLVSSIPNQLHALSALVSLDLSDNQISGTLPPQLGSLSNLQTFKMTNDGLKGSIPTSYCNLVSGGGSLRELYLTGNGGLVCYPGCLLDSSNPNVLVIDPNLHQCGKSNDGAGTITISQASDDERTITIAAGVAGGLLFLLCLLGLVCLLVRSRRPRDSDSSSTSRDRAKAKPAKNVPKSGGAPPSKGPKTVQYDERSLDGMEEDAEVGNPIQSVTGPQRENQQRAQSMRPPPRQTLKPLPINARFAAAGGGPVDRGPGGGGGGDRGAPQVGPDGGSEFDAMRRGTMTMTPQPPQAPQRGGPGHHVPGGGPPEKPRFQFGAKPPPPGPEEHGSDGERSRSGSEGSDGSDGGHSMASHGSRLMKQQDDRRWGDAPHAPEFTGRLQPGGGPGGRGLPPDRRQTMGMAGMGMNGRDGPRGAPRPPMPHGHNPGLGGDESAGPAGNSPNRRASATVTNSTIRPEMQEAAMGQKKFSFMMARGPPPPPPGLRGPPPGAGGGAR